MSPPEVRRTWFRDNWTTIATVVAIVGILVMLAWRVPQIHAQIKPPEIKPPATQPATPVVVPAQVLARVTPEFGLLDQASIRRQLSYDPGTPSNPADDVGVGGTIYLRAVTGSSYIVQGGKLDLSNLGVVTVVGDGDNSILWLRNGAWVDCSGSQIKLRNFRVVLDHAKAGFVFCRGKNKNGSIRTDSTNRCGLENVTIDCAAPGSGASVASIVTYGCEHFTMTNCAIENNYPGGHTVVFDSAFLPQFGYSADAVGYTNSSITLTNCMLGVRGGDGVESALVFGDATGNVFFSGWICSSGKVDSLVKVVGGAPAFSRLRTPDDIVLNFIPECDPFPGGAPNMATIRFTGNAKPSSVKVLGYYADLLMDGIERGYVYRWQPLPATN